MTVVVDSLAEFEQLKDRLEEFGFRRTEVSHRLRHRSGGRADILPFSHALAPGGRLVLQEGRVLNMAGFEQVVPSAVNAVVEGGLALPVVPLPLYALLKMVAFSDRKEPKDLAGLFHCLQHYLEDDDRRYGAEHNGRGVPFEYTGAYVSSSIVAGDSLLLSRASTPRFVTMRRRTASSEGPSTAPRDIGHVSPRRARADGRSSASSAA